MQRKPYQKYKPSGVEWLGEVPEHWEVKKLKYCLSLNTRKAVTDDNPIALENIESWTGRFIETDSEFEGDGIAFNSGDILFGKLRPYLAKVYLTEKSGESMGDIFVLRPTPQVASKYAADILRTNNYIEIIDGSTYGSKMPRASWEFMGNLPFPLPPHPEQQAIAAFLDSETGRIDALIGKKQKLVELLKEKRTALISRAVTKGLDAKVKMKPSGVEWLGDVPEHWEVWKLSHLTTRIGSGKTPTGGADVYQTEGVAFLRSQNVYDDGLHLEDVVYIDESIDEDMAWSRVRMNDILLNITGASLGRTCITPAGLGKANVNQHVCVIRLKNAEYSRFIAQYLKSRQAKSFYDYVQTGSAREGLNFEQIGAFPIPLPPLPEQQAIAAFLDREMAKIDALVSKVDTAIEKLKEYRTALISAAVTGKIDVSTSLNTGVREVA